VFEEKSEGKKKNWHKLGDVKNMLLMVIATTEKNDNC
jgi:hypothetical protein